MKRILVAVDLMEETKKLVDTAKRLAKQFKGELCIVHSESIERYLVSDEFEQYPSIEIPKIIEIRKKSIKQQLDGIKQELKDEDIKSKCVLLEGTTAANILKEAKQFKADLIIMGSHKHGKFYHLILGSLHDLLIKKSNIPIMIIPPEEE